MVENFWKFLQQVLVTVYLIIDFIQRMIVVCLLDIVTKLASNTRNTSDTITSNGNAIGSIRLIVSRPFTLQRLILISESIPRFWIGLDVF